MNKRIIRKQLEIAHGSIAFALPRGAELLHIGLLNAESHIFFLVDDDAPIEQLKLFLALEDQPLPYWVSTYLSRDAHYARKSDGSACWVFIFEDGLEEGMDDAAEVTETDDETE